MNKIYEICVLGESSEAIGAVFSEIEKGYRAVKREILGEKNLVYPIKKQTKAVLASIWLADQDLTNARKILANAQILRFLILKTTDKNLEQESLSAKIDLQKKRDEIRVAQKKEAKKQKLEITPELPAEIIKTDNPQQKLKVTTAKQKPETKQTAKAKPTKQDSEITDKKRLEDLDKKLAEILSDDTKI